MRELAERGCHLACLALGRMLRAARYATTRVTVRAGVRVVRKRRSPHAPLLVLLGRPLTALLDAGVRVLPQREWEARERTLHERLRGARIEVERDGTLVLPFLTGDTLAALLERATLSGRNRERAIALAVDALARLHRAGFTHGDAMAENVMVDLDGGVGHWFDFETLHDPARPLAWRRADDLRALVATCTLRIERASLAETVRLMVERYGDPEVIGLVAAAFTSSCRRAHVFHFGQAPLSLARFREVGRLLRGART